MPNAEKTRKLSKSDKPTKPKKTKRDKSNAEPILAADTAGEPAFDTAVSTNTSISPKLLRCVQKSAKRISEAAARLSALTDDLERALQATIAK